MQNAQTMFTIFTMVSIATMRDTMQHGDEEKEKKTHGTHRLVCHAPQRVRTR